MTDPCILIGDIGGTNARFALVHPSSPGFTCEMKLKCRNFDSAADAINAYLEETGSSRPEVICVAAAGPVINGEVLFTNSNWKLNANELASAFDGAKVGLLNDFEAIGYALPHLKTEDYAPIGTSLAVNLDQPDFCMAIIGPGTGLGAGGIRKKNAELSSIIGEGGHVGFAPETPLQTEILARLRGKFERVCDERLISGPGIINIHQALADIRGEQIPSLGAADIFSLSLNDEHSLEQDSVALFFEVLGQVAGNLALTLGAYDGVFIGGGIVSRYPGQITSSLFRKGFEHKGRHRALMEKIPTLLILHPHPGLLGASHFAREKLR